MASIAVARHSMEPIHALRSCSREMESTGGHERQSIKECLSHGGSRERERESRYVLTKFRKCFTIFWGIKCFPTFITVFFSQQKTFSGLIKFHNEKNTWKCYKSFLENILQQNKQSLVKLYNQVIIFCKSVDSKDSVAMLSKNQG